MKRLTNAKFDIDLPFSSSSVITYFNDRVLNILIFILRGRCRKNGGQKKMRCSILKLYDEIL